MQHGLTWQENGKASKVCTHERPDLTSFLLSSSTWALNGTCGLPAEDGGRRGVMVPAKLEKWHQMHMLQDQRGSFSPNKPNKTRVYHHGVVAQDAG